jgi:hypothetical protein
VILYAMTAGLLAGGVLMLLGAWPWAALVLALTGFAGLGYLVGITDEEHQDAARRNRYL